MFFKFLSPQTSVLCTQFCIDSPYSLVVGGEKNGIHIINVANLPQGNHIIISYFTVKCITTTLFFSVMQRFKDRKLLAPVTPPSQVVSSQLLATKATTDEVCSMCVFVLFSSKSA